MGLLMAKLGNLLDQFEDNPMRILMLGLDAAGKTTVMDKLKLNEKILTTTPTIGFNVETVTPKKGLTFTAWDVGRRCRLRYLWQQKLHYIQNTQGLIYVVDSNDREKLDEALEELTSILEVDEMRGVPVVVLANKQGLPSALSAARITEALQLHKLQGRKWQVQATCAQNGEGLYEAMDILGKLTKEFKQGYR